MDCIDRRMHDSYLPLIAFLARVANESPSMILDQYF